MKAYQAKPWKRPNIARKTILLVVEGDTEVAFFGHVKTLYISRGCGVTVNIKNAHGKGADNVIDVALRDVGQYDQKIAVYDADTPASAERARLAKKRGVFLFESRPAIEGLLLRLLNKPVPHTTGECKARLSQSVQGSLLEKDTYARYFPQSVLDAARTRIPEWDNILQLLAVPEVDACQEMNQ